MARIGFPKPRMKEERRIALLPNDISEFIEFPDRLFFERGYGKNSGKSDDDYRAIGARVVDFRRVYSLDILCQPKFCEFDFNHMDHNVRTVIGWLHLDKVVDEEMISEMSRRGMTAIAYEFMNKDGRNLFYLNSIITGQMAVLHSMPYSGKTPSDCNVAIIGRGAVGSAVKSELGIIGVKSIDVYHSENIGDLLPKIGQYDVFFECACTNDEIYDTKTFEGMKPGALFVDLGRNCMWGAYKPQSIYSPITHINSGRNPVYCIQNIPTMAHHSATAHNSHDVAPYLNLLSQDKMDDVLNSGLVIHNGQPLFEKL